MSRVGDAVLPDGFHRVTSEGRIVYFNLRVAGDRRLTVSTQAVPEHLTGRPLWQVAGHAGRADLDTGLVAKGQQHPVLEGDFGSHAKARAWAKEHGEAAMVARWGPPVHEHVLQRRALVARLTAMLDDLEPAGARRRPRRRRAPTSRCTRPRPPPSTRWATSWTPSTAPAAPPWRDGPSTAARP